MGVGKWQGENEIMENGCCRGRKEAVEGK